MTIQTTAQFKAFRLDTLKVTQKQLAEKVGITANYVSLIETGRRPISSLTLLAIAKAFDLSFSWEIK